MPKNSVVFPFPQDLREAQLALHQTRAEYEEYARTLPWSVEPMPGWETDKQLHSTYVSAKPESPGYSDEQAQRIADYRARLLELSVRVSTHPFWETVGSGDVVAARMALKHAHEA
ncbi:MULTISPECIES: hypothetical protein [unclassified Streptomyces]|uniref:hypothetical protein n=1 Tax=unclassified Streptomyces TaxID=2593676 RepID=UPI00093D5504|nr:hypothetical protein [Streptomyces sp. TSRI0281]OKI32205.1 hypothetical protein A6A29_21980 [Streptomyces sp. TSRI0281]